VRNIIRDGENMIAIVLGKYKAFTAGRSTAMKGSRSGKKKDKP